MIKQEFLIIRRIWLEIWKEPLGQLVKIGEEIWKYYIRKSKNRNNFKFEEKYLRKSIRRCLNRPVIAIRCSPRWRVIYLELKLPALLDHKRGHRVTEDRIDFGESMKCPATLSRTSKLTLKHSIWILKRTPNTECRIKQIAFKGLKISILLQRLNLMISTMRTAQRTFSKAYSQRQRANRSWTSWTINVISNCEVDKDKQSHNWHKSLEQLELWEKQIWLK